AWGLPSAADSWRRWADRSRLKTGLTALVRSLPSRFHCHQRSERRDLQHECVMTKIMIVEDELAIRRLLRTSLTSQGFQVIEAADGRQALAEIGETEPDLVILDLGLPDIQGQELIRVIRGQGSTLPIV